MLKKTILFFCLIIVSFHCFPIPQARKSQEQSTKNKIIGTVILLGGTVLAALGTILLINQFTKKQPVDLLIAQLQQLPGNPDSPRQAFYDYAIPKLRAVRNQSEQKQIEVIEDLGKQAQQYGLELVRMYQVEQAQQSRTQH